MLYSNTEELYEQMHNFGVLPSVVILLAAAIFIVIFFKRLKLSPVLGYFVAGAVIGDYGLKIVTYEQIHALAEYGVVFLLFAIGLELSFERLKALRKYVFGLGSMQVIISSVIIAAGVTLFDGEGHKAAVIIGGGLAMSSTAVVLQVLHDSRREFTQVGRVAFAILLLQDFAVVPLLVIVPKLSGAGFSSLYVEIFTSIMKAALALAAIFIVGRLFFRPVFGLLSNDNDSSVNELFIAATLLVALAAAFGTEYLGLSLALGAFTAGVLVAETEFQRKAEESISPFKGLLLGLFFMSVGMTIDIREFASQINLVILFTFILLLAKASIIAGLCILFRFDTGVAIHSGLLLAQGGEFAFILFKLAMQEKIISESSGELLLLVVTCSMALTPLLSYLGSMLEDKIDADSLTSPNVIIEKGARDLSKHVIIAGFGKVGKMVARVLSAESVNYIVLDMNEENVKAEELNGFPIFKGDISSTQTLTSAGADRALAVIIAISNSVTQKKALKTIAHHYPELCIILRTKDLKQSSELYELGATIIVPEDYETGLQLGGAVLKAVGVSEFEIARKKEQFRAGNYIIAHSEEDVADEY